MGVSVSGPELRAPGELKGIQFSHDHPYFQCQMWVQSSVIALGLKSLPELTEVTEIYCSHVSSVFHIEEMGEPRKRVHCSFLWEEGSKVEVEPTTCLAVTCKVRSMGS